VREKLRSISVMHTGLVILFVLLAMYAAWINAVANVLNNKSPYIALRFAVNSAGAKTAVANQMLSANPSKDEMRKIGILAKSALISEILNPESLRLLALSKITSDDPSDASVEKLMQVSSHMSRRDIITNSWFIESSIAKGDAVTALKNFDTTFRSDYIAQTAFFPRLSNLMLNEKYRSALTPYIKNNASWLQSFLSYTFSNSSLPTEMSELIISSGGLPIDQSYRDLEGILIGQLVSAGNFKAARSFYISLSKDMQWAVLRSPAFTPVSISPNRNPISWTLQNSSTTDARFVRSGERSSFALIGSATAGGRGVIARKLLFLDPGTYQLSAKKTILNDDSGAELLLLIKCVPSLSAQNEVLLSLMEKVTTSTFSISSACLQQELSAVIASGDGQNGTEIMLSELGTIKL
jgi:hypothetical protein